MEKVQHVKTVRCIPWKRNTKDTKVNLFITYWRVSCMSIFFYFLTGKCRKEQEGHSTRKKVLRNLSYNLYSKGISTVLHSYTVAHCIILPVVVLWGFRTKFITTMQRTWVSLFSRNYYVEAFMYCTHVFMYQTINSLRIHERPKTHLRFFLLNYLQLNAISHSACIRTRKKVQSMWNGLEKGRNKLLGKDVGGKGSCSTVCTVRSMVVGLPKNRTYCTGYSQIVPLQQWIMHARLSSSVQRRPNKILYIRIGMY